MKHTTATFIEKANKIHNNKYDYSKSIYENWKIKITITCLTHGDFKQLPLLHLYGQGCPKCDDDNRRLSVGKYIEKAKAIHGDKYDYSKVNYINSETKVIIICKDHGEFKQLPSSHTQGIGCPVCKASKGESSIKELLIKNNIKFITEYRIPEIASLLRYDFYLPDYNTLIEFHGIQHYKYIPYFHGEDDDKFLKQKIRDDLIRNNARLFKYRYLEFNYKQFKYLSKEQFEQLVIERINK